MNIDFEIDIILIPPINELYLAQYYLTHPTFFNIICVVPSRQSHGGTTLAYYQHPPTPSSRLTRIPTQPPLHFFSSLQTLLQVSIKEEITRSSHPLETTRWLSCYLRGRQLSPAAEVASRQQGSSTQAFHRAPSCYQHCSAFTYLTCHGQHYQSSGCVIWMTSPYGRWE